MQKSFSVLNSDRISKYGTLFTISAMEDMVWMKSTEGVPMHIGHDMHRPIGLMIPFGLYFEPKLVRNIGLSLIPENDEESKQILDFKHYSNYKNIKEAVDKNNGELLSEIEDYIVSDYKYIETGTIAIVNENIVDRVFTQLASYKDKNGLIKIVDLSKDFTYKYQGVFLHNTLPLCIYAHSFFRRSLSRQNNFHYIFLDEFMKHQNNTDVTIKIAIDWDMIGYSPTFLQSMEFEFWFGPKYNDDISKIAKGLTKHKCDDFERNYYGLSSTEFYWKDNNNLKEFELEELRENNAPTLDDFYGCRYLHSIYDTIKSTFVHFDGAIRGYTSDLYFERIDVNMTDFGRRSDYTKIFRIDGDLKLSDWKSLVTNYMQDNPLIYEYFDAEKPISQLNKKANDKTLIQKLVPNSIDKDDGIRLLLSYHKKNENYINNSHSVSIYDIISVDNKDCNIIEDEITEIKKALKRLGKNLFIKEDTLFGNCKDEYWNIPCIFHSAADPTKDLAITLDAFKMVFGKMISRSLNTIVSFTLAWNIDDKEIRISSLGHIENLSIWLSSFESIPTNREELKKWLEKQRLYLNETFNESIDKPLIQDICQTDGVLYIKRKIVGEEFKLTPKMDGNNLSAEFSIPNNDSEKYKSIIDREIQPVMSYILKKGTCSKTKQDYFESPHSKLLDDDTHMIVEEIEGLSFYWTDKPLT